MLVRRAPFWQSMSTAANPPVPWFTMMTLDTTLPVIGKA